MSWGYSYRYSFGFNKLLGGETIFLKPDYHYTTIFWTPADPILGTQRYFAPRTLFYNDFLRPGPDFRYTTLFSNPHPDFTYTTIFFISLYCLYHYIVYIMILFISLYCLYHYIVYIIILYRSLYCLYHYIVYQNEIYDIGTKILWSYFFTVKLP